MVWLLIGYLIEVRSESREKNKTKESDKRNLILTKCSRFIFKDKSKERHKAGYYFIEN